MRFRLAYAGVTLFFFFFFFFFWSGNNFWAETVCMKASHHTFKTKQQAVEGDETCACFASFGPRSLRIGLQRVSKPSTTTLKLTKATTHPPDPRSSPIPKFLVTSCQSLSLSTLLLRFVSEQSKQGHCTVRMKIGKEKRSKSAFVDLRHRPVGMYSNESLFESKGKPFGAVKSALSCDGDKRFSTPLDLELL